MNEQRTSNISPEVIDFALVGVQLAALLEQAEMLSRTEFAEKTVLLLPLLYVKTRLLPPFAFDPITDYIPEYINEAAYEAVRAKLANLLCDDDTFLTADHDDMQYSDRPIALDISECLADVYQETGNLLGALREEQQDLLPAAIGRCRFYFSEHWGNRLLNALMALHRIETNHAGNDESSNEE